MKKITLILSTAIFTATIATSVIADAGADAYNAKCASCHGAGGAKPIIAVYPKLNGQNAAYTVKQIKDFQSGARKDPTMNAMANLVRGQEQAIADYLATQ